VESSRTLLAQIPKSRRAITNLCTEGQMNYYLILINGALGGASLSSFDGPFASKEEAEEHKKTLHYGHGDDVLLLPVEGEIKSCEEV
jgi:hypothetical protein